MTKDTHINRREFLETSTLAAGTLAFAPGSLSAYFFGPGRKVLSAVYSTELGVKFVHTGVVHQEAYEGSCRWGNLEYLTEEAETRMNHAALEELSKKVGEYRFGTGIKALETEGVYLWVEKENPEIMLKEEELRKLDREDPLTDVYVVTGGLPQFTCVRIAETYGKPVLFMSPSGWGIDVPGGVRAIGYDSFYVQDMEQLGRLLMVFKARKAFRHTRFLNVTNFDIVPKGVISSVSDLDFIRESYGMDYHTVDYREFFGEMDRLGTDREIQDKAAELTDALLKGAGKSNMTRDDVKHSFDFYLTVLHFLGEYDCNAFGIECFELCSSMNPWNRRFTPCMTHSLLKNEGFPSTCEKDLNALLAMGVLMYVSNRPAYMGNPDFDLDKQTISLHHSDSPTRMMGFGQADEYYEIKHFTGSGFGVTLRYDYDAHRGQEVTLARFDPTARKLLVFGGEITGGGGMEGLGCSQRVTFAVKDCRETMRIMQDVGHHLSMVYGNCIDQVRDLAELMGFEVLLV